MTRRFGGSLSTAQAMQARLQTKGQQDGINFQFGNRIGSSRDAHRLIYLAKRHDLDRSQQQPENQFPKGSRPADGQDMDIDQERTETMQNMLVAGLFKAYFEENGDITSHEMLLTVAEKAGLDKEIVTKWLSSDEGGEIVDKEAEEAVTLHGITGVPVIFINDTVRIDGAQDVEDFFMELVRVRDGAARAGAAAE